MARGRREVASDAVCDAKFLILSRTIFIPLSSEAFISNTRSFSTEGWYNVLATAKIVDVLPVPGGPYMSRWGSWPCAMAPRSVLVTSSWDARSSMDVGRYFSTQSCVLLMVFVVSCGRMAAFGHWRAFLALRRRGGESCSARRYIWSVGLRDAA